MCEPKYYILQATRPVQAETLYQWANWMATHVQESLVDQTETDLYYVSTRFLGIDYAFGCGPSILFETAVFSKRTNQVIEMARYHSWAEAKHGHHEIAARVSAWQ